MDLTVVAVYTIYDGFLISCGHQEHPQAQTSDWIIIRTKLML